jgi:hypothetical protein
VSASESGSSSGSSSSEPTPEPSPSESSPPAWCDDLLAAASVLDEGGSVATYDRLLDRVVASSPTGHAPTWALFVTLSREPFTYETFNPAVDSLDRIGDEVVAACPGFARVVVDDDGRLRHLQPDA